MLILHTTDIHGNYEFVDNLITEAAPGTLIAVSGDIVSWNGTPDRDVVMAARDFLIYAGRSAAAKDCHLAFCSGNHDSWISERLTPGWCAFEAEGVSGDLVSRIVSFGTGENFVLTCLPWRDWENPELPNRAVDPRRFLGDIRRTEQAAELLATGAALRDETKAPWIWLHHNPPTNTPVTAFQPDTGSVQLDSWIWNYRPDWVLCGHIHQGPFADRGEGFAKKEFSSISNPGRGDECKVNRIVISAGRTPAMPH